MSHEDEIQNQWKGKVEDYKTPTIIKQKLLHPYIENILLNEGNLLDAGCGPGYFSRIFSNKGYKVIGIDQNPKPNDLKVEYYEADLEHISLDTNSIDNVLLINVLSCISKEEKRLKILEEIFRISKNKTKIIIVNCDENIINESFSNDIIKTNKINDGQFYLQLKKVNGNFITIKDNLIKEKEFLEQGEKVGLKRKQHTSIYSEEAKRYVFSVSIFEKR